MSEIRIHSDSSSGDVTGDVEKNPTDNTAKVTNYDTQAFVTREIDNRYNDLSGSKQEPGQVNFLGSSYTGVDIRVVAHMYDVVSDREERIAELNEELSIAQTIVDGCSSLIGGGINGLVTNTSNTLTPDQKESAFFFATGIQPTTDAQWKALRAIIGTVLKNNSFTFLGAATMRINADKLREENQRLITSLNQRLDEMQQASREGSSTVTLATLQTISVQSFREKNAVRALGHSYAKGYTRGARTIGGSMIFTLFNEHAFANLIRGMAGSSNYGSRDNELSTLLPDQLPPLDLTIVFANEYGSLSDFRLYGVEFVTNGSVYSIEDLLSEETVQFVARNADVMTSRGKIELSRSQRGMFDGRDNKDITGSSLLFSNDAYVEYLDTLGVRRRLINR